MQERSTRTGNRVDREIFGPRGSFVHGLCERPSISAHITFCPSASGRCDKRTGSKGTDAGLLRGRGPLVLAPHTIMCMGVESFTDENRSPLHVGTYISLWWT